MTSRSPNTAAPRKPLHRRALEEGCELAERLELEAAAALFLRAAKLGSAQAQVNLGNMLDEGTGVAQDFYAARHWYKKAVHRGLPEAAFNLSLAYRSRGNVRMGNFWLERAAQMGDKDAKDQLLELGSLK